VPLPLVLQSRGQPHRPTSGQGEHHQPTGNGRWPRPSTSQSGGPRSAGSPVGGGEQPPWRRGCLSPIAPQSTGSAANPWHPTRDFAMRVLDGLPDGDRLCHGDYHPGNVLLTANRTRVIDQAGAASARARRRFGPGGMVVDEPVGSATAASFFASRRSAWHCSSGSASACTTSRRPGHRSVRRRGAEPGHPAEHRVRAAQRDRGLRRHRPACGRQAQLGAFSRCSA
jgi:Phosphotransferase enzyme family